ncbi:MAG TPA: hypothetical protein VE011_08530 [Candidatus Dormibacteraeota bacterium]|nr:hypothetical protein [Candidatus Dormibacteraeota bacterium]
MSITFGVGGFSGLHSGHAPSPFDALNGSRLAGSISSHPLHDVRIEDLFKAIDGPLTGSITIDGSVRVGDPIKGTIDLTALEAIESRHAYLRLVCLRLVEERKSVGSGSNRSEWVQADGSLFVESPFLEPAIPFEMAAGDHFTAPFAIPGPPLGPPTAHLGEAIVAWAVEVRFDVAMGTDYHVSALLPIAQNPDLLAAGVGDQGGDSMLASVDVDGGTISIDSPLPARAGSTLVVRASWPTAHAGAGRIELHSGGNAPNGVFALIVSAPIADGDLASGAARAELALPADLTPSFDGANLSFGYSIRVLVDRRFRPDDSIQRVVAVI